MTAPSQRVDGFLPLRGYAAIGDGRSCALVGADGGIDWWALPIMSGDPAFAAILDPERGGRLTLRPTAPFTVERWYADGGGVLVTEFTTAAGKVQVWDSLNLGLGGAPPWTELARRVEAVSGDVEMRWEVVPGESFAGTRAWPHRQGNAPLIAADGHHFALVLHDVGGAEPLDGGFTGRFTASPGSDSLVGVIATDGGPVPLPAGEDVLRRLERTVRTWASWRDLVRYDGPWREAVIRSALVHKQLTLEETGALQAAATTSLPEKIGGSRNFDYRYSWVRDTGFALDALSSLGLTSELHLTTSYLVRAVSATAPDVRVFYDLSGAPTSGDIDKLQLWRGYRDSSPVQRGNSAATQRQLGTYGDLLDALAHYVRAGHLLDGDTAQLVSTVAERICDEWTLHDAGLWELGQSRPYTSSKIGCWTGLRRAVELAEIGQVPVEQVTRWREVAEEIHRYVNESCWSASKQAYTFYAGTDDLDCATLLAARTGFCDRDDPRLNGTIDAVRAELAAGGPLLFRYSGMRGQEGAFVACSFWLVEALAYVGRVDEACRLMDEMVGLANDVGLLSEEIEPDTLELVGNIPQTLSHLALIGGATACARALARS